MTPVTSPASVATVLEAGFSPTALSRAVILEITSAQVVAAALWAALVDRVLAAVLAAVRPVLLAVRALALASRSEVDSEQAEIATRPSSSNFLQREKLPLQ